MPLAQSMQKRLCPQGTKAATLSPSPQTMQALGRADPAPARRAAPSPPEESVGLLDALSADRLTIDSAGPNDDPLDELLLLRVGDPEPPVDRPGPPDVRGSEPMRRR